MHKNTWLITGASSGLGYALARHVLEQGERVVMGARTVGPMSDLANRYPDQGLAVELDVTDPDQRAFAVQRCRDHFGSIDVLVNSAGIDFWGAIEEQDEADYRATFEVNLFGAVELIRLVLPGMRRLRRGTIVNISSLRGIVSSGATATTAPVSSRWRDSPRPYGRRSSHWVFGPCWSSLVLTVLAWILGSDSPVQSSTRTRAPPAESSRSWQISIRSNSPEIQPGLRLPSTKRCARTANVIG